MRVASESANIITIQYNDISFITNKSMNKNIFADSMITNKFHNNHNLKLVKGDYM